MEDRSQECTIGGWLRQAGFRPKQTLTPCTKMAGIGHNRNQPVKLFHI
jgi:hypothetical protein